MNSTIYLFRVFGMHCASCGLLIDETLEDLAGVVSSQTSVRSGMTTVRVDPARISPEDVAAAISATGYPATWER